jgi:hypothetical protein
MCWGNDNQQHPLVPPFLPHPTLTRLHCPGLRVPAALLSKHQALIVSAIKALRPSRYFESVLQRRRTRLAALTGQTSSFAGQLAALRFNMLHMRVERDWFAHCAEWQVHAWAG